MRWTISLLPILLCLSPAAEAQVKDSNGRELGIGRPLAVTSDYGGGRISRGRAAKCVMDDDAPAPCVFFPRNGDGSFAIDVDGLAYYAQKVSPTQIEVDYDNGARFVPQGTFTRSRLDPACWVQRDRRICIY